MRKTLLSINDVTILSINKGSVTVSHKTEGVVLITKRLFNKLLHGNVLEGFFIERIHPKTQSLLTWFGMVSIF